MATNDMKGKFVVKSSGLPEWHYLYNSGFSEIDLTKELAEADIFGSQFVPIFSFPEDAFVVRISEESTISAGFDQFRAGVQPSVYGNSFPWIRHFSPFVSKSSGDMLYKDTIVAAPSTSTSAALYSGDDYSKIELTLSTILSVSKKAVTIQVTTTARDGTKKTTTLTPASYCLYFILVGPGGGGTDSGNDNIFSPGGGSGAMLRGILDFTKSSKFTITLAEGMPASYGFGSKYCTVMADGYQYELQAGGGVNGLLPSDEYPEASSLGGRCSFRELSSYDYSKVVANTYYGGIYVIDTQNGHNGQAEIDDAVSEREFYGNELSVSHHTFPDSKSAKPHFGVLSTHGAGGAGVPNSIFPGCEHYKWPSAEFGYGGYGGTGLYPAADGGPGALSIAWGIQS